MAEPLLKGVAGGRAEGHGALLGALPPDRDPTTFEVEVGDTFAITAGCNKTLGVCIGRFANKDNFRGFPHVPVSDDVIKGITPTAVEAEDGGTVAPDTNTNAVTTAGYCDLVTGRPNTNLTTANKGTDLGLGALTDFAGAAVTVATPTRGCYENEA